MIGFLAPVCAVYVLRKSRKSPIKSFCLLIFPNKIISSLLMIISMPSFESSFSELSIVQGGSITLLPSATNRSRPNNYLFYNRIPKCGSSTAMQYMRTLSYKLKYHWIGKKLILFNLRIIL